MYAEQFASIIIIINNYANKRKKWKKKMKKKIKKKHGDDGIVVLFAFHYGETHRLALLNNNNIICFTYKNIIMT